MNKQAYQDSVQHFWAVLGEDGPPDSTSGEDVAFFVALWKATDDDMEAGETSQ